MDGIERDLGEAAKIVRLDRHTPTGRAISARLGLLLVPAFVVFDEQGEERLRAEGKMPDRQALVAALKQE